MNKLVHQTRLAHPGLAEQGHELAVSLTGLRQRLRQRRQLLAPARQSASVPRATAACNRPTERTRPDQLEDLDGLQQPLHREAAQGRDLHQALHQPQGRCRQPDASWRGELFHACRQVRGLADGRVVHMQVVANGAHHHLARVQPHADPHLQAMGVAHLLT